MASSTFSRTIPSRVPDAFRDVQFWERASELPLPDQNGPHPLRYHLPPPDCKHAAKIPNPGQDGRNFVISAAMIEGSLAFNRLFTSAAVIPNFFSSHWIESRGEWL